MVHGIENFSTPEIFIIGAGLLIVGIALQGSFMYHKLCKGKLYRSEQVAVVVDMIGFGLMHASYIIPAILFSLRFLGYV